jgi:hypothetical protein
VVPCSHELSADKTSPASQLEITLLPYYIGLDLACPRELSTTMALESHTPNIPRHFKNKSTMWVRVSSLAFPPSLHPI